MAYFCGANNDTKLEPLVTGVNGESLIGWDGKPIGVITAGEYFSRQFDDLYGGVTRTSEPSITSVLTRVATAT